MVAGGRVHAVHRGTRRRGVAARLRRARRQPLHPIPVLLPSGGHPPDARPGTVREPGSRTWVRGLGAHPTVG
ncbi:hypothetical protein [Ornithinimicrobium kibberense]|uniref:hypothetical protein n=1 Tax=Ornithinimicrobium kibberense TaxID=282060 RepID=UPI0036214E3B